MRNLPGASVTWALGRHLGGAGTRAAPEKTRYPERIRGSTGGATVSLAILGRQCPASGAGTWRDPVRYWRRTSADVSRGCSSMVEPQPSKLVMRVRFPSSALTFRCSESFFDTHSGFADARIPVESYRGLVAEVDGPAPDDIVHIAAAVAGQVESLVTWNVKDFDCEFTAQYVRPPIEYLPVSLASAIRSPVKVTSL